MASLTTPPSITLSNPTSSLWSTIVPSNDSNLDTATKKHYSAGSAGVTDVFFELSNGVITVDVNSSPTGGSPQFVSKTGSLSGGSSSITVTTGDTVYLYNTGNAIGNFVWQSTWTGGTGSSGSGGSGGNTGSITYDVPNETITVTIDSTSESDAFINYHVTWVNTSNVVYQYGPYGHTLGTTDSHDITSNDSLLGTWRLITIDSNYTVTTLDEVIIGGGSIAPTSNNSSQKKVFCNFW